MQKDIENLLRIIEEKLGWGEAGSWQIRDFENLQQLIADKTGVTLSATTLRRIWGLIAYQHLPSTTTLNVLASFAGFENWRIFLKTKTDKHAVDGKVIMETPARAGEFTIPWIKMMVATLFVIVTGLLCMFAFKTKSTEIRAGDYHFSSKKLSNQLPNSVVFTYDATASPTDSIFIQQEWDPQTRTIVGKNGHTLTSIYYEPAFYHPQLIVGAKVVNEQSLLIGTNGWLGVIKNKPIPIYLNPANFIQPDMLRLSVSELLKSSHLETVPPIVRYYNVGSFEPVPVKNFSFSAEIRNDYNQGVAACQFSDIVLLTDGSPIVIPLSVKGCISDLILYAVDVTASGKTTDLSGFGVDFRDWARVSCLTNGKRMKFIINEHLAYECPVPEKEINIVGMEFAFLGTGSVRNIKLETGNKILFHDF